MNSNTELESTINAIYVPKRGRPRKNDPPKPVKEKKSVGRPTIIDASITGTERRRIYRQRHLKNKEEGRVNTYTKRSKILDSDSSTSKDKDEKDE